MPRLLLSAALLLPLAAPLLAQEVKYDRKEDVIYGRKFGLAMTLDVFTPKDADKQKANGAGVIFCVSGGWFSAKEAVNVGFVAEFLKRGYVCFAVVHGSQPKFTIPEVLDDMHRAVRYIRHHAKDYNVDPDRLGICGASAGGHLSLMQGTAPKDADPKAKDPVDQESSKVAVVGCFFPPTDFLNYGKDGAVMLGRGLLEGFKPPFDFTEVDAITHSFNPIFDETKRRAIGKAISPYYHVSKTSAPALIIHGDKDTLVPIQQAERIIKKYEEAKVDCKLVVKEGVGHGWVGLDKDLVTIADWFDSHLAKKEK
jgi:acetyl esterase/lipase